MKRLLALAAVLIAFVSFAPAQDIGIEAVYDFETKRAPIVFSTRLAEAEDFFVENWIESGIRDITGIADYDFDIELRAFAGVAGDSPDVISGFSIVGVWPLNPNGSAAFYLGAAWIDESLDFAIEGRPGVAIGFRYTVGS